MNSDFFWRKGRGVQNKFLYLKTTISIEYVNGFLRLLVGLILEVDRMGEYGYYLLGESRWVKSFTSKNRNFINLV
jgi:hypothetical protein